MTRQEAEQFLFEEARLIDERRFDDWLALFAPDCLYWLPIGDGDPNVEPSLIYDDYQRLQERVFRISQTAAPAQTPASRTLHNVSNVEVLDANHGHTRIGCNLLILEFRPGDPSQVGLGTQRVFGAKADYILEAGPHWRIRTKKVSLLNRDAPLHNLTFIF